MKIEKGIMAPAKCKYPFGSMEVGDSFLIEKGSLDAIRSAASIFGTRNNMKFSCRKVDGGLRVWRVQ